MSFDHRWEAWHAEKRRGIYPNEHFVRFVMQNYGALPPDERAHCAFLDLGCGAGAQTRFLHAEGFRVDAVDASLSACEALERGLPPKYGTFPVPNVFCCNVLNYQACASYDCVVDVCTLQHLSAAHARAVITDARKWLKPRGRFFSLMASLDHLMTGDLAPRCGSTASVVSLFGPYNWDIITGHEKVVRPGGTQIGHHIIEARLR